MWCATSFVRSSHWPHFPHSSIKQQQQQQRVRDKFHNSLALQAIIYDATGRHPQCSQGTKSYMQDCVLPSDYYSYILSADPVLDASGKTCDDLGYTHVSTDPIFHGFELYWKGGPEAARAFSESFHEGHPDTGKFLNASRDYNPACSLAGAATSETPEASETQPTVTVDAYAGPIVTSYDKSGTLPQCAEGPAVYMTDCVHPCDFVAYFKSTAPTVRPARVLDPAIVSTCVCGLLAALACNAHQDFRMFSHSYCTAATATPWDL